MQQNLFHWRVLNRGLALTSVNEQPLRVAAQQGLAVFANVGSSLGYRTVWRRF